MRSRASFITVTIVLAACFACPLIEMFDRWDETLQTGSDTEYAVVVLALCVGVAYLFARFIPKLSPSESLVKALSTSRAQIIFPALRNLPSAILIPASPPPLALRI